MSLGSVPPDLLENIIGNLLTPHVPVHQVLVTRRNQVDTIDSCTGRYRMEGPTQSVMPEGNQRIDARCLSRRHVRREKGSDQQRYHSQRQCQRIVGRHAVQE